MSAKASDIYKSQRHIRDKIPSVIEESIPGEIPVFDSTHLKMQTEYKGTNKRKASKEYKSGESMNYKRARATKKKGLEPKNGVKR